MALSNFRPKTPPREKRDRAGEFDSFTAKARTAVSRGDLVTFVYQPRSTTTPLVTPYPKTPARKSQAIRDSARGEECEIRLPGCDGGGETTVWCHLPEAIAGRGMGLKGIDILGAAGCRSCHDIVDRRAPRPAGLTEQDVALAFYRALARSLVKLKQKGLV